MSNRHFLQAQAQDALRRPLSNSTGRQSKIASPFIETTQFKNAVYYGEIDASKSRSGIGIVIYDEGDVIIGKWLNNNLEGEFFYFLSGAKSLCFYGRIFDSRLQGNCYVYARDNLGLQTNFTQGKPSNFSYFFNKFKTTLINENCTEVDLGKNLFQDRLKFKNSCQKQKTPAQDFQPEFIKPTDFILKYLSRNDNISTKFTLNSISSTQLFYGTLKDQKSQGYGVIFTDEWPVCYGNFASGELEGLGRVQNKSKVFLDGYFEESQFKLGWVLNYVQKFSGYGTMLKGKDLNRGGIPSLYRKNEGIFQFQQQRNEIDITNVAKFRRQHHIRSLSFTNSYHCELSHKIISQFRYSHLQYLLRREREEANLQQQDFIPSFISEIDKASNADNPFSNRNTQRENACLQKDLMELIMEQNETRNNFEQVSRALEEKLTTRQQEQTGGTEQSAENNRGKTGSRQEPAQPEGNNMRRWGKKARSNKPEETGRLTPIKINKWVTENSDRKVMTGPSPIKKKPVNNSTKEESKYCKQVRVNLHQMYKKYLKATTE